MVRKVSGNVVGHADYFRGGCDSPANGGQAIIRFNLRECRKSMLQAHAGQVAPIKLVQFLSQTLERRGELAGSIAHETRQPIAAAHTSVNAGLRWLGRDHPDIKKAQESMARIIQEGRTGTRIGRRESSDSGNGQPNEQRGRTARDFHPYRTCF